MPDRKRGLLYRNGFASVCCWKTLQLILDVRRDIFPPLRQTGQGEAPHVDTRVEILAKTAFSDPLPHVAMGAGNQLKIAAYFFV